MKKQPHIRTKRSPANTGRFTLLSIGATSEASAEQLSVYVNHAPQSFREVLSVLDTEDKFRFSNEIWFSLSDADVWAIFLNPETDLFAVPELMNPILERTAESTGDLTRLTATLDGGNAIMVQVSDFSKEISYGPQYRGCFAALDLASMAYPEIVVTSLRNEICLGYGDK